MPLKLQLSEEEIALLEAKAKQIKGRREYCRLQSILLVAKEKKTPEEAAQILEIHPRSVYKHHERYFKQGLDAFKAFKTGPKGPILLKTEEEIAFFEDLATQAKEGHLLKAAQIQPLYEEKIGRSCAKSTIYVVLKRNNWSKKQPRPRHPKGDDEAKCLFKKTC